MLQGKCKRVSLARAAISSKYVFDATNHIFCSDKSMFVATKIFLSRQKLCRDKLTFVATNMCLSRQNTSFVANKLCFSRQTFSRGKHTFVATKVMFRHDKHEFVATKMVLVAAPANDKRALTVVTAATSTTEAPVCSWYYTDHASQLVVTYIIITHPCRR